MTTTAEQFVTAWHNARKTDGTIRDVADSLGITPKHAHEFASKLRAKGVKFPKLRPVPRTGVNVRNLNKILRGGK